jgi:uncharacterized coiled-coil protein SlyX
MTTEDRLKALEDLTARQADTIAELESQVQELTDERDRETHKRKRLQRFTD